MDLVATYSDIQLWEEIKRDNYKAFDVLIDRYWKLLINSSFKRIKSLDVCEDLVQDLFLNLWTRRASLEIENVEAYLKTAIRYRVFSYYSRNKMNTEFIGLIEHFTDPGFQSDHKIYYTDLKKLVNAWIDTLPARQKKIFQLYLQNSLTTKEIAQQLNISQKTVQNQINRSIGVLRARLSGNLSSIFFFLF